MAHYGKGTFLIPVEENGQIPILKQKRRFAVSACFYGCAGISEVHERKTGQIGSCSGGKDRRIADGRCKRRCAESSRSECAASGGTKKERVNGRISSVFEKEYFRAVDLTDKSGHILEFKYMPKTVDVYEKGFVRISYGIRDGKQDESKSH